MNTISYLSAWLYDRGITNEVSVDDTIYVNRPGVAKPIKNGWLTTIQASRSNSVDVWGPSLLFSGLTRTVSLADPRSFDQIATNIVGWYKITPLTLTKLWKWENAFTYRYHPQYAYPKHKIDRWLKFAPEVTRLIEINYPLNQINSLMRRLSRQLSE